MAEVDQDKGTLRSFESRSRNSGYCWSAFFHLLRANWGISILGPVSWVYCSIPLLIILAAASIYSDVTREYQKPELTVYLAEEISPDSTTLLIKMAAAVSVTDKITFIEPKTAAEHVADTLNLTADLQEAIKFPGTIHIVFPKDADPLVLEELAQLLAEDSRVTDVHSTIETYKFFQEAGFNWLILISVGFCFTGVISLLFGYSMISIISRPHLPEMSNMFLFGVPNTENSRPLHFLSFLFGVVYLLVCIAVYPALLKGLAISADWFFYLDVLGEIEFGLPSAKVLISLGLMIVFYTIGVSISVKKIHLSIMKLACQD